MRTMSKKQLQLLAEGQQDEEEIKIQVAALEGVTKENAPQIQNMRLAK